MSILSQPTAAFPLALIYITVGTLIDVWTILAYFYYPPESTWGRYLNIGFMVTGFALLAIGLFLGRIGRAARDAELPPTEAMPTVENAERVAAENPPPVVQAPAAAAPVAPKAPSGPPSTPSLPQPLTPPVQQR